MRRKLGVCCMVLGTVLIALALSLLLYNRWESDEASSAAEDVLADLTEEMDDPEVTVPIYNRPEDGIMPTIEIDGYDYIGTLSIPSLSLELPIMSEWSYPGLKIAPGRYSGSVWTDDMILCGHNYARHFGNLKYLKAGDEVRFTDVLGNEFSYEVVEVIILQPTDIEEMLSQENGDWDLTLFTCTIGGQTRVTVRCMRAD